MRLQDVEKGKSIEQGKLRQKEALRAHPNPDGAGQTLGQTSNRSHLASRFASESISLLSLFLSSPSSNDQHSLSVGLLPTSPLSRLLSATRDSSASRVGARSSSIRSKVLSPPHPGKKNPANALFHNSMTSPLFSVVPTPFRGKVLQANVELAPGTLLFREKPFVTVPPHPTDPNAYPTISQIETAVTALPTEDRAAFFALSNAFASIKFPPWFETLLEGRGDMESKRIFGIWRSNQWSAYGPKSGTFIFRTYSVSRAPYVRVLSRGGSGMFTFSLEISA
jgi:hypothetical protein